MVGMQIVLEGEGVKAFLDNLNEYLNADMSDEAQFLAAGKRLMAVKYEMEDMLVEAGMMAPLNERQRTGRTRNPYYTPTLAKAGGKP